MMGSGRLRAQQKQAVIELVASHHSQGRTVVEVLGSVGVARSSYYRWKKDQGEKNPVDIVDFVATMHQEIADVFRDVLIYVDALERIGKETFAIDGCKLPSNASGEWSGTHDVLKNKQQKYEAAAKKIAYFWLITLPEKQ